MSILVPVLLRTFGRTGSTLLMQVLGTSPLVLFERQYPFEHRYLSYVYQMSQQFNAPVVTDENWNNGVLFQGRSAGIGCLPYDKTDLLDRGRLAQRALITLWQEISREMRLTAGIPADEACFYAEKIPHKVADVVAPILGGRTIYLLRDPRDELVSIRSFNQKRGFYSFGWKAEDDEFSYAKKMCANRRAFMRDLLDSKIDHQRYHIKYEDLVTDGEHEVARLSEWLGTPLHYAQATKDRGIKQKHMTSRSLKSSVGRWRCELNTEVQEIFSRELGPELVELGYAI